MLGIRGSADQALARAQTERKRFEAELRAQEANISEPGEDEATRRLRDLWTTYQADFDRLSTARDAGAARTLFLGRLAPGADAIRGAADKILALNHDAMTRRSEAAHEAAERLNTLLIAAACASLLGGLFLSITITNRLLRPLALLTRAVQQIGEGDFDARISVSGRDEVAQLAGHVNAMAARLKQYRRSSLGELLLAQQAAQAAIDALPDPVVVFAAHGGVLNANRAAEALLGISVEDADDRDPLHAVDPTVRALLERVRDHVLKGKGPYEPRGLEEATPVAGADGGRYYVPRGTPLLAEEGDVAGATVTLQDVTRLRRVDELRNDVVATLARELCTPLASLRMGVHLCLEQAAGPLTEKQTDILYACRDDCDRLQSTTDELLHLARIQGTGIDLDRQPTSPAALVETAIDAQRPLAAKHYVQLECEVAPGVSDVDADRERVRTVLTTLLTNAIRRSRPGGVVAARARAVDGQVRFEVTDDGEPIPDDLKQTLFDRFADAKGPGAAVHGLSFAKEIVDAHGGRIDVERTPAGGAMFWFTLLTAGRTDGNASQI